MMVCSGRRAAVGVLLMFCSLMAVPQPVSAAPITLDFSSVIYGAAEGLTGPVVINDQGVLVTLSATGGVLHRTSDGFGVDGPTGLDDSGEIGVFELFGAGFAPPLTVYAIGITQLFNNDFGFYQEKGQYSVNGGAFQDFAANSGAGNFVISFGPGLANVNSLRFRAPGLLDDYSVKSLTVESPVATPEPASLILLGSGLLAVARARRRSLPRD